MKIDNLLPISSITTITMIYLVIVRAFVPNNWGTNSVFSRFEKQTIELILYILFSSKALNVIAAVSLTMYVVAVVARIVSARRVDWILILATFTLPLSIGFLLN